MTNEQLDVIRQRWQATTAGEWITTADIEGSVFELRIVRRMQIISELAAAKIYLAAIGSTYPIAPERAIETIDQAITEISDMQMRIGTVRTILEMIQVATTDDNARAAAASALKALQEAS